MHDADVWAPYTPTEKNPWDLRKVAHLHRRAGFGATWAELQRDLVDGPKASADRLLHPRAHSPEEQQILDSLRQGVLDSRDADRLKAWWLYRILYDPDPLREKMALFWHNHFATSNSKVQSVPLMLQQNELFRRHAFADWPVLLTEVIGDPAMLTWLDGGSSRKAKPNENFAREFLELFTLGVGHYREKDVREAARAFTGWKIHGNSRGLGPPPSSAFDPAQFDDGEKKFLGHKGRWRGEDIVRIALEQPAAAEFLCRKLYRFFVTESEEPPVELIKPLADELRSHHYSIRRIVETILRSRHFYSPSAYRQRIKSPVDWSAGLVRMLEVPRAYVNLLLLAAVCEQQGQELFYPPNVKGWDGGKSWLTSASVLSRSNWAADVIWGNSDLGLRAYDPVAWAGSHDIAPEKVAGVFIDLVLQANLDSKARTLILSTGQDGKSDSIRKALQLLLHCPDCQLA